jgi:IPT/TIG domain
MALPASAYVPAYVRVVTYNGGVKGDDVDEATATLAMSNRGGNAAEPSTDYAPRTQAQKATQLGTTLAVDIASPRGWIDPGEPYLGNAAPPVAPVVSSIAPATAVLATSGGPFTVVITGTGFTPWSKVYLGGQNTPEISAVYVSPTKMRFLINPLVSVVGSVTVVVEDHNVKSNATVSFTFT